MSDDTCYCTKYEGCPPCRHDLITHDPSCPYLEDHTCQCSLIAAVRADEREQARQRVLDAPEQCVKIKGIMTAVIQRGDAAAAAEGDKP